MNIIGDKIRQTREQKGFSQDNLAQELGLTQPSYARLEKDDDRINIPRLIHIAKVLNTTVSELIGEKSNKIINQKNTNNESIYVDSVINSDKDHIKTLKEEIVFLRNLLEKKE